MCIMSNRKTHSSSLELQNERREYKRCIFFRNQLHNRTSILQCLLSIVDEGFGIAKVGKVVDLRIEVEEDT